jgi:hypothetical protein
MMAAYPDPVRYEEYTKDDASELYMPVYQESELLTIAAEFRN